MQYLKNKTNGGGARFGTEIDTAMPGISDADHSHAGCMAAGGVTGGDYALVSGAAGLP